MEKNKMQEPLFLEGEEWRWVPGHEGYYEASTEGRIRTYINKGNKQLLTKIPSLINGSLKSQGYLRVTLGVGNKISTGKHRVIALTFLENPENKPEVNHKNGIKTDNRLVNLEYVTRVENQIHSWEKLGRVGGWKGKLGKEHHASKRVRQRDKFTKEFIRDWDSIIDIKRELGYNAGNIASCCRGERRYYKSCIWEFI